ncbi:MAG: hypothetical protein GY796_22955 [Chloroflexi bacterium]|nr:hypothetical protein [Chloroflexota bacterium]
MNDAVEALSIGFTIAIIFGVPFGFFAFVRYLRYKETITLAEQGLLRPERARRNRDTLKWGVVIMMMGLGLTCGVLPIGIVSEADPVLGPWVLIGILPLFFGLSLIIVYALNKHLDDEEDEQMMEPPIPPHKQVDVPDDH